jgi:hypothetical protein
VGREEYTNCCRRKGRREKNGGEWEHGKLEKVEEGQRKIHSFYVKDTKVLYMSY